VLILAAAVQLIVGWSKSFPVTIGRPGLRILTHGIETIVVLPLTLVFGSQWGAAGAAGASRRLAIVGRLPASCPRTRAAGPGRYRRRCREYPRRLGHQPPVWRSASHARRCCVLAGAGIRSVVVTANATPAQGRSRSRDSPPLQGNPRAHGSRDRAPRRACGRRLHDRYVRAQLARGRARGVRVVKLTADPAFERAKKRHRRRRRRWNQWGATR
jgi:hypothetical protein